jgi:hypothetical protein
MTGILRRMKTKYPAEYTSLFREWVVNHFQW